MHVITGAWKLFHRRVILDEVLKDLKTKGKQRTDSDACLSNTKGLAKVFVSHAFFLTLLCSRFRRYTVSGMTICNWLVKLNVLAAILIFNTTLLAAKRLLCPKMRRFGHH